MKKTRMMSFDIWDITATVRNSLNGMYPKTTVPVCGVRIPSPLLCQCQNKFDDHITLVHAESSACNPVTCVFCSVILSTPIPVQNRRSIF